jgi:hypothetical protein
MTTLKFGYWKVDLQTRQATEIGVVASEHTEFINDRIRSLVIKPGARGEPVIVLGMTDAYTLKAASNGIAKPVYENQVFASAWDASIYIGFDNNRVGTALSVERRRIERDYEDRHGKDHTLAIRPQVVVREITFQYVKDLRD